MTLILNNPKHGRSEKPLLIITVFIVIIFLMSLICIRAMAFPPAIAYSLIGLAPFLLVGLFVLNLASAICVPHHRIAHSIMSLVVILAFVGASAMRTLSWDAQQQWFLQKGISDYDAMIEQILQHKMRLKSYSQPLDDIVGRPNTYGHTNADGSLYILFLGRANDNRHGYLYYSGNHMVARSGNTNVYYLEEVPREYYVHVTNGWYMY